MPTPVPTPIPSTLEILFPALRQQLINSGVFNESSCFLSLTPEKKDPECADNHCAIKPYGFDTDKATWIGGGNIDLYIIGEVEMYLWNRLNLDAGQRADNWLYNPGLGVLPKITCMIAALSMFQPLQYVTSNQEVVVPVMFKRADNFKRDDENEGWGYVKTTWTLEFQQFIGCNQ